MNRVDWIAAAVIVAVSAAVPAGWWLARRRIEKGRSAAMRLASSELGMDCIVDGSELLASEGILESAKLWYPYDDSLVYNRNIRNVFMGGDGAVVLFDAEYQINLRTDGPDPIHRFTVAAFRFSMDVPDFTMHPWVLRLPYRIPDRINVVLGAGSSNLDQAFANNYVVRGEDEAAIVRSFGSGALAYFAKERSWSVESTGSWLLVWRARPRKRVAPKKLSEFMQETTRIAGLFRASAAGEKGRPLMS